MGGRFDGDDATVLVDGLQSLPNMDGNTVLVHLGDFNSPYATSCVESSFQNNVDLYQQSSSLIHDTVTLTDDLYRSPDDLAIRILCWGNVDDVG